MDAGEVIQGRYLLEERLGKGGMGQVWRAVDQRLQRTVAIKLIAPQLADEPEFLVRFLREAQSIARISHPNVVGVLDFGEADDKPFLVMEYVPGQPLAEMTGEAMEPDKAVAIIAQSADAAGAAHAEGIVHRDIKPANVIVTDEGRAKLVDFGIAAHEDVDRITATGTTIGSPHYISPEQASGGNATPRSDVYALGIVLFELLTGRRPFEGDQVAAVAIAHVEKAPPAPSQFVPELDPQLEGVVLRCLAKDPADRFADGRELARALAPDSDAKTMLVPAAGAAAAAAGSTMVLPAQDAVPYESDPFDDEDEGDSPWKAALLGLLIGLVVLALAVGAYALLSGDEDGGRGTDTSTPSRAPAETNERTPETSAPQTSAPPDDPETSAPDPGEDEAPPPDEEPSPEEEDEEPSDEETIEGDLETDPDEGDSNGQGPGGEGPPGQQRSFR